MAGENNPDSNVPNCVEEEKLPTIALEETPSATAPLDGTPLEGTPSATIGQAYIDAVPISIWRPHYYTTYYEDVTDNSVEDGTNNSVKDVTNNSAQETQSAERPTPRSKRVKPSKDLDEWIKNWDIEQKPRKNGSRVDKFYRHKKEGFVCRSLVEVEQYEKFGIRAQRPKKKTEDRGEDRGKGKGKMKIEDDSKVENDSKEVMADEKSIDPEINEEMLIAERRREAEKMKDVVQEFLAEAYNNLRRMNDP